MGKPATKGVGDAAEALALAHVSSQGMRLVRRNYRVAAGPRRRGGEIDLICRDTDGTLVFVEVRTKTNRNFGVPEESITAVKKKRLMSVANRRRDNIARAYRREDLAELFWPRRACD